MKNIAKIIGQREYTRIKRGISLGVSLMHGIMTKFSYPKRAIFYGTHIILHSLIVVRDGLSKGLFIMDRLIIIFRLPQVGIYDKSSRGSK